MSLLRNPELRASGARLRAALKEPVVAQAQVLRSILERNADCDYGKRFDFAGIVDTAAYQQRVPVSSYDDLRDPIERMARGETRVLVADPVIAFEETGGSAGGAKLIPYTAAGLREFQAGLLSWLDGLCTIAPGALQGRGYWAISPACRVPRCTRSGLPIGMASDAAYFGATLARQVEASLAVPPQVGMLDDVAAWRRSTLRDLVNCEDLSLISVWSPTFLIELLAGLASETDAIAHEIASGAAPASVRALHDVAPPAPNPARARALTRAMRGDSVDWRALWPRLALISCWDHAQARPYAARLRALFPGVPVQGKGLLATEGLVSIPVVAGADPVLAVHSGFFEFIDASNVARTLADVVVGAQYQLLLTTSSGLYRYAIGDRVRVTGYVERTPTIEFLGRCGVSCDLCGEKLDEDFVAQALRMLDTPFRVLVPDEQVLGYVLVLDAREIDQSAAHGAVRAVEMRLARNPQYDYARRIGQLAALRACRVERPLQAWLARGQARGQRLGDIKLPALYPHADWRVIFGVVE